MVQATIERPAPPTQTPTPQAIADALWDAYKAAFATEVPLRPPLEPLWSDGDPALEPAFAVLRGSPDAASAANGPPADIATEPLWTNADAAFALAVLSGIAPPRLIARGEPAAPEYLTAEEFLGDEYL
jgi:hypothetical protein